MVIVCVIDSQTINGLAFQLRQPACQDDIPHPVGVSMILVAFVTDQRMPIIHFEKPLSAQQSYFLGGYTPAEVWMVYVREQGLSACRSLRPDGIDIVLNHFEN